MLARSRLLLLLVGLGGPLAAGCGSAGAPSHKNLEKSATAPVTGIIKFQGKAVGKAAVSFQSASGTVSPRGVTDASGMFSLSTYGTNDGAPVGIYRVVVAVSGVEEISPGVLAPEPAGGFKSPIPTKYANPTTTDISVEVKEGPNNLTIDLK